MLEYLAGLASGVSLTILAAFLRHEVRWRRWRTLHLDTLGKRLEKTRKEVANGTRKP